MINKKNLVPYCMHKIFHVCLYHFLINLVSTHSELRIRMFAAKTPWIIPAIGQVFGRLSDYRFKALKISSATFFLPFVFQKVILSGFCLLRPRKRKNKWFLQLKYANNAISLHVSFSEWRSLIILKKVKLPRKCTFHDDSNDTPKTIWVELCQKIPCLKFLPKK